MYEFDESRRPLLILRMRGHLSAADIAAMKADVERVIERAEPFAILWDVQNAEIPPRAEVMDVLAWTRSVRHRFTEVFEDASPRIPTFTAYHLPGMFGNLLRFFMQMLPSLRAQHLVCSSFDEALAACERALRRMGSEHDSRHVG